MKSYVLFIYFMNSIVRKHFAHAISDENAQRHERLQLQGFLLGYFAILPIFRARPGLQNVSVGENITITLVENRLPRIKQCSSAIRLVFFCSVL